MYKTVLDHYKQVAAEKMIVGTTEKMLSIWMQLRLTPSHKFVGN
jgi:hypothetical protein